MPPRLIRSLPRFSHSSCVTELAHLGSAAAPPRNHDAEKEEGGDYGGNNEDGEAEAERWGGRWRGKKVKEMWIWD